MNRSALGNQRRRAVVAVGATVALAASALTAGILLGPSVRSPAQAAAEAAPPSASTVTAAAERRVLAEPVVLRGAIVPGESVKLAAPAALSGPTAVVTAVAGKPGKALREGKVFLEVAGAPLYGLVLPFPLYRDLHAGLRGPDVAEVQKALRRLGHPAPADGVFDARTQAALDAFYRARGYSPPAGEGGSTLPRGHVVRLDRSDRVISAVPVGVGTVLTADTVVLELDVAPATLRATLTPRQRPLVAVDSTAGVTDEVRGITTRARVRQIAAEPTQTDQGTGYVVSLAFTGEPLTPVKEHTVLITIDTAGDAAPVLAVPVTAVFSRPDGATLVGVVDGSGRTSDVPVRTGRTAGGWVAVEPTGGGLAAGDLVAVGTATGNGG